MKRIVVEVPGMYGDHHVPPVRAALLATTGVEAVSTSAAQRKVAVQFDEAVTSPDTIQQALASAGYPTEAPAAREFPKRHEDGSEWHSLPDRSTTTERKDREMAGDFRRY